mmetsp:Transcript_26460/g.83864  ORF Transcript_26460/g.83864 Transcript_26460/m.83864 type:complete len:215 (+) Transcript_26460:230-874(+)
MAAKAMAAACAPGSTMPRHMLSGTFSERPALGAISFVASAPAAAASLAPLRPWPATRASAAGTKASSMVRLPREAPPASIMACRPSASACAPASDHVFFPALSKDAAMPMNMMLINTPLEPPMLLPRTLPRQLQVALASARGSASFISSTFVAADAIVAPQSASPTLLSSSSSCCLAPTRALQTFSRTCATASSLDGTTPSMGSRPLMPSVGFG